MKAIHNILFTLMILTFGVEFILLAGGNNTITTPLLFVIIGLMILVKVTHRVPQTELSLLGEIEDRLNDEVVGKQVGFDEAVVGFDYHSLKLIYSTKKCIEILMEREGWDEEGASEFFYFNIAGARGQDEPIWLEL